MPVEHFPYSRQSRRAKGERIVCHADGEVWPCRHAAKKHGAYAAPGIGPAAKARKRHLARQARARKRAAR